MTELEHGLDHREIWMKIAWTSGQEIKMNLWDGWPNTTQKFVKHGYVHTTRTRVSESLIQEAGDDVKC